MRLAFLVSQRHMSGGAFYLCRLAEGLARLGHDVSLEVDRVPPLWPDGPPDGLRVRRRPALPFVIKGFGLADRMLAGAHDCLVLGPRLQREGTQVIVGQQTWDAARAHRLAVSRGALLVTTVFETPDWLAERLGSRWQTVWAGNRRLRDLWAGLREAVRASALVLTISRSTAERVVRWAGCPPDRVVTAYPGLELPGPWSVGESGGGGGLVYVGRLIPAKNLDLLLRAAASLNPPVPLTIVGEGPSRSALEEMAAGLGLPVRFTGEVDEPTKWRLLARADCKVFPSSFEGFGMPPGEALAAGTPCVATDLPILREVYGDRLVYFHEGDVEDLVSKIQSVLREGAAARRCAAEAGSWVQERYTWDESVHVLNRALQALPGGAV